MLLKQDRNKWAILIHTTVTHQETSWTNEGGIIYIIETITTSFYKHFFADTGTPENSGEKTEL